MPSLIIPRSCLIALLLINAIQPVFGQAEVADSVSEASRESANFHSAEPSCTRWTEGDDDRFWGQLDLADDWGNLRSSFKESGVTFTIDETQFVFGISGGVRDAVSPPLRLGNTSSYTGRGNYKTILDLEKLAGVPQGTLLIGMEHWYGQFGNISLSTGTLSLPQDGASLPPAPNAPGVPLLTNFLWTQPLSDELVVYLGKLSVIGGGYDKDIFAGGDGTNQFSNLSLVGNPAFLLGMPYSSFTTGFSSTQEWGSVSAYILDPTDRTTDAFRFDNLFSQGIIVGTEITLTSKVRDLDGQFRLGGVWKHVPLTNLKFQEPPPGVYPYPTVPGFPTLNNSYTIYSGFDQYLVTFAENDRGWGVFGRASISDGNPTPLRYFLSTGIGGFSPIGKQRGDTFGLGWYYIGISNQFGPVPRATYGPRDGTGLELFYNIQATPWLNITPDFQYVHPESGEIADDSFVYGLRVNAKF